MFADVANEMRFAKKIAISPFVLFQIYAVILSLDFGFVIEVRSASRSMLSFIAPAEHNICTRDR